MALEGSAMIVTTYLETTTPVLGLYFSTLCDCERSILAAYSMAYLGLERASCGWHEGTAALE